MEVLSSHEWSHTHFEFLLYVVSAMVAFPATLFFLYTSLRGVFSILRSVHHAVIKSSFIFITIIAGFSIMYYYFLLDVSMEKIYPREHSYRSPNLFYLQATSSHTLCLILGVTTSQWVKSHTRLSQTSRFLFSAILLSLFFIGSLTWFYFFFEKACFLALQVRVLPVTLPQACSSALSHWLSFVVGMSMLYEFYRRGFHEKGQEAAVLQYYTLCGIALACLPHAWKAVHQCIGFSTHNPLMSPCLWSFLSMFLISFVSIRRLSYYTIALFSVAAVSIVGAQESPIERAEHKIPELYSAILNLFENAFFAQIFAVVLISIFIFALCAEFVILLSSSTHTPIERTSMRGESVVPRRKRAKNFPPLYPNGWYRVFNSEDVSIGESKYINICGEDLAVYRGEDGKIAIVNAFCPHLGANLGIGGKVKGNCIECPFHGWQFDGQGTCVSIPYATKIPSVAKTRSWPVLEFADMICVYYHIDGEEADFVPLQLPEIDTGRMTRYHIWERVLDMHIQDFAENAADYAHFNFVHDDLDIPFGKSLFFITHNVTWHAGTPEEPTDTRFSYFTDDTRVHCTLFPNHPFPQYVSPIVLFSGPGLVYFRFRTPIGDILLIKTFQPLDAVKLHVQDRIYADPRIPGFLVRFVTAQALHAFLDDVTIWENKSYSFRPLVIKEDGPMNKVRRWFTQFYTENSVRVSPDKNSLSW